MLEAWSRWQGVAVIVLLALLLGASVAYLLIVLAEVFGDEDG